MSGIQYQDILNESNITVDNLVTNNMTIANLTLSDATANKFIGTDVNNLVSTRYLYGTSNMVIINDSSNNSILSLPQEIATNSNVRFNDISCNDLSGHNLYFNDSSNNHVYCRDISANRLQCIDVSCNTTNSGRIIVYDISGTNLNISNRTILTDVSLNSLTSTNNIYGSRAIITDISAVNISISGNNYLTGLTASKVVLTNSNKALVSSSLSESDIVDKGSIQTITGTKVMNIISLTSCSQNKLLRTNISKDVVSSSYDESDLVLTSTNQSIAGNKTFSSTMLYTPSLVADTTNTPTILARTSLNEIGAVRSSTTALSYSVVLRDNSSNCNMAGLNLSSLTASKIMLSNGSKDLISSSYSESDLLLTSTNQSISGIKTFNSQPIISTLTASKIVLSDSSKGLSSSSYGESDLLLTSTNQSISGIKNFTTNSIMTDLSANNISYSNRLYGSGCSMIDISATNLSILTNTYCTNLMASKLVLTDSNKILSSSTLGISDICTLNSSQDISGVKTFTSSPIISYNKNITFNSDGFIAASSMIFGAISGSINAYQINIAKPGSFQINIDSSTASLSVGSSGYTATKNNVLDDSSGGMIINSIITVPKIKLLTTGGTKYDLDYYEEYSDTTVQFVDTATNISTTATIKIVRIGKIVNLTSTSISFNDSAGTRSNNIFCSSIIPSRFRPNNTHYHSNIYTEGSGVNIGLISINTAGTITYYIKYDFTSTWAALANFIGGNTISWTLN